MSDIKTERTTAVLRDAGVPDDAIELALGSIDGTSNLSDMLQHLGIESKDVASEEEVVPEEVEPIVEAVSQDAEEVLEVAEVVEELPTEVEIAVEVSVGAEDQKDILSGMVAGEFKNLNVYLKSQAGVIDALVERVLELEKDTDTKVEEKMAEQYHIDNAVWNRPSQAKDNAVEKDEEIVAPSNDPEGQGGDEVMNLFSHSFGSPSS